MNRDTIEMLNRVQRRGLSLDDALAVRRISMTLTRWYELKCGDSNDYQSWGIERDEATDKPYMVHYPHSGKSYRVRVADRERGAIRRLDAIMDRYPGLRYYLQTDPRGASVYLYRPEDLDGRDIDCCYSSVGTAVYR